MQASSGIIVNRWNLSFREKSGKRLSWFWCEKLPSLRDKCAINDERQLIFYLRKVKWFPTVCHSTIYQFVSSTNWTTPTIERGEFRIAKLTFQANFPTVVTFQLSINFKLWIAEDGPTLPNPLDTTRLNRWIPSSHPTLGRYSLGLGTGHRTYSIAHHRTAATR